MAHREGLAWRSARPRRPPVGRANRALASRISRSASSATAGAGRSSAPSASSRSARRWRTSSLASFRRTSPTDRPRRAGGDRRQAGRRVSARGVPDRIGHADQHERQRSDRQPGDPARRRRDRIEASRSIPTTTSTTASRPTTCFRPSMHIAAVEEIKDLLIPAVTRLCANVRRQGEGLLVDIVMVGRTHLQDATPLTLGQVISGWVAQLDEALVTVEQACAGLYPLAIGGTAVGTGLNADPRFGDTVARKVADETGQAVRLRANKFAALSAHDAMVNASAALRTLAGALMKIANDVRWYASRPARRHRRDQDSGERARLLDHAGQDQSDAVRGDDHGCGAGLRQRPRRRLRRLAGQLPAQRVQAGHAAQRAGIGEAPRRRLRLIRQALRAAASSRTSSASRSISTIR